MYNLFTFHIEEQGTCRYAYSIKSAWPICMFQTPKQTLFIRLSSASCFIASTLSKVEKQLILRKTLYHCKLCPVTTSQTSYLLIKNLVCTLNILKNFQKKFADLPCLIEDAFQTLPQNGVLQNQQILSYPPNTTLRHRKIKKNCSNIKGWCAAPVWVPVTKSEMLIGIT